MVRKLCMLMTVAAALTACHSPHEPVGASSNPTKAFADFDAVAAKFKNRLLLPEFETTTNAVMVAADTAIAEGNAALDAIGRLKPSEITLRNTVLALDDMFWRAALTANRLGLTKETSLDAGFRDAATEAIKKSSMAFLLAN